MSPSETTTEKPMPRGTAQSSIAADHRARLAEKSDVARRCGEMRKARVEPEPRHHDTDAVRSEDAHQVGLRGGECGLLQRATPRAQFAEPGGSR